MLGLFSGNRGALSPDGPRLPGGVITAGTFPCSLLMRVRYVPLLLLFAPHLNERHCSCHQRRRALITRNLVSAGVTLKLIIVLRVLNIHILPKNAAFVRRAKGQNPFRAKRDSRVEIMSICSRHTKWSKV